MGDWEQHGGVNGRWGMVFGLELFGWDWVQSDEMGSKTGSLCWNHVLWLVDLRWLRSGG